MTLRKVSIEVYKMHKVGLFLCGYLQIKTNILIDVCVNIYLFRSHFNGFPIGSLSIAHAHHIVYVCNRH